MSQRQDGVRLVPYFLREGHLYKPLCDDPVCQCRARLEGLAILKFWEFTGEQRCGFCDKEITAWMDAVRQGDDNNSSRKDKRA